MTHLCITVRWLDDRYHGLLDRDGPPEWPPSPYRLFQALVAGVARAGKLDGEIGGSLEWLEGKPPIIVAPRSSHKVPAIARFVPNNDGDKVPDRQNRLTGTRLLGFGHACAGLVFWSIERDYRTRGRGSRNC